MESACVVVHAVQVAAEERESEGKSRNGRGESRNGEGEGGQKGEREIVDGAGCERSTESVTLVVVRTRRFRTLRVKTRTTAESDTAGAKRDSGQRGESE